MKRVRKWLLPACVFVAFSLFLSAFTFSGLEQSTRAHVYASLEKRWKVHWPYEFGLMLPERIRPLFGSFTPEWREIEPGIKMLLDPLDLVPREIMINGSWEPETWSTIAEYLKPGGSFVDVGAHIGYFSLKASQSVGETGRVVAIEPNPWTLTQLRGNIDMSEAANIEVVPVACSDSEGTLELFGARRQNTGRSTASQGIRTRLSQFYQETHHVRARPLDAVLHELKLQHVDVLKVDVEGAEMLVLKGARQTLERDRPMIVVEILDGYLATMGTDSLEITNYLDSLGYKLLEQVDDNCVFAIAPQVRTNPD